MSNYKCIIKIKATGEIKNVTAWDDYFGKHQYGYNDGNLVYKEEEVEVIGREETKKLIKEYEKTFTALK
jgi:hypothetical protein